MSTPQKTKLPYILQGRILELVLCVIAFVAAVIAMLQIPFNAHSDSSSVTVIMFTVFGIEALVAAILFRRGSLKALQDKDIGNPFHRWYFFWFLPLAIFAVQLPWIFSGVFNADDMNTIGAAAMLLFLPWLVVGAAFLFVIVFWAPLETMARGLYKVVKTGGKDGVGQLTTGAYFSLWVVIIICAVLAASTDRVSYEANGALLAAFFGLPGDYIVKDPTLLWVTRILVVIAIALPLLFKRKRNENDGVSGH